MSLRRYDLNLLPVLDALLRHRNLTKAGQELGISQSAMSHSLTRLRAQLSDQLLVQSGREMVLTYHAEALAEPLSEILGLIDNLLGVSAFDSAQSTRQFRIGTGDHMAFLLIPELLGRLESAAPNVSVQVTWDTDEKAAKLRSNRLDLAIVVRGTFAEADLCCEPLFEDELVVIAAQKNRAIKGKLDLKTYQSLKHARVKLENVNRMTFADMQESRSKVSVDNAVTVTSFVLLPFLVANSDRVALVPRRLALRFQKMAPLKIFEPPFHTEKMNIDAYWSYSANRDAGHRWLRNCLIEQCRAMAEQDRS